MYLKQQFAARGDDGNSYDIHVYGHRINTSTLAGPSSIEGLPELRTSDGFSVNRLDRGRYTIVQTGVMLESNDPNAF